MQPQKGWCWQQIAAKSPGFLSKAYINTFYTNTLGMSKNHPQQYWNEYTTFMCHTILHLLPYHLDKAFFCSQLKGLLVSLIPPIFPHHFLLPFPKEQVSHFLIQLLTALVTRNLFLPLGGRVGRFLVFFFVVVIFHPLFSMRGWRMH